MFDSLYKVQTRFLFHSQVRIKLPASCREAMFDDLFMVMERVDSLYNSYCRGAYTDRINRQAGRWVDVDEVTIRLLRHVLFLSGFFGGRYDITIMPLLRLWGFYKKNPRKVPSAGEIAAVLPLVDFRKIRINGTQVRIEKGQEIVTGSFLKAYAVDRVVDKIREMGVEDALINAGGSTIRCFNNETHPHWRIDVRMPEKQQSLFLLKIDGMSFSTSSQEHTFLGIDGKRYGHILNPATGYPSPNRQVGLITEDCFTGDILSTALFNESPESFLRKIEELRLGGIRVEGFLIGPAGEFTCTDKFIEKYTIQSILS